MKKNTLSHGDFTKIAAIAGISVSTVQGFYAKTKNTSPRTKRKIYEAWMTLLKERRIGFAEELAFIQDIKTRLEQYEEKVNHIIQELNNTAA